MTPARSSRKRSGAPDAKSQRYEGLLQVFDAKGRSATSGGRSNGWARTARASRCFASRRRRRSRAWRCWSSIIPIAPRINGCGHRPIERDRRIALQDRSTRFFGTDFSFEDLEERDVNQYDYAVRGEEMVDGAACWRIESTPKQTRSSQYTRSMVWVRKDNYAFARIENFVRDQTVRRLNLLRYPEHPGHLDRAPARDDRCAPGSRTRLLLDNLQYNVPLNDEDFTLQALRRQ
jgi:hypothetical protein